MQVQNEVSQYFNRVYKTVKEVERDVIAQIKASENLKRLREAHDQLYQKLNHKEMDLLQEEKRVIDSRVDTQRYCYIVQHRQHYESVQEQYTTLNRFLEEKIEGVRKWLQDIEQAAKMLEVEQEVRDSVLAAALLGHIRELAEQGWELLDTVQ